MAPYRMLETKQSFILLALKVIAVAYERWSLTRGFKYMYSDSTWKLFHVLENGSLRRGGGLREVVMSRGSTVVLD